MLHHQFQVGQFMLQASVSGEVATISCSLHCSVLQSILSKGPTFQLTLSLYKLHGKGDYRLLGLAEFAKYMARRQDSPCSITTSIGPKCEERSLGPPMLF